VRGVGGQRGRRGGLDGRVRLRKLIHVRRGVVGWSVRSGGHLAGWSGCECAVRVSKPPSVEWSERERDWLMPRAQQEERASLGLD
jgi:hypothetical protein